VAFADRVIVNKVDLVSPEELEDLQKQIRSHNSTAMITTAIRSRVDLESMLNINAFEMNRALDVDPQLKFQASCCNDAEVSLS